MKKLLFICLMVGAFSCKLQAQSCFGPTTEAQVATMWGYAGNATCTGTTSASFIQLAAGTIPWTYDFNIPCTSHQVTLSGPVVPLAPVTLGGNFGLTSYVVNAVTPTAVISNSGIVNDFGFSWPNNCGTAGPIIQYIEWNGNRPSGGGGGFIQLGYNVFNSVIQYNYIHGFGNGNAQTNSYSSMSAVLYNGYTNQYAGYPTASNNSVIWNQIGSRDAGDCEPYMEEYQYYANNSSSGNMDSYGGQCGVTGFYSSTLNQVVAHNVMFHIEQASKGYEGNPFPYSILHNNFLFQYNDMGQIHRISAEYQDQPHTTMNFDSNSFHDQYYGGYGGWAISAPMSGAACGNGYGTSCTRVVGDGYTNHTNNLFVWNASIPKVPATFANCASSAPTWSSSTTYGQGAGVQYAGQGYYANPGVSSIPAGTPLTNTSYWLNGCYTSQYAGGYGSIGGYFYPGCHEFGGNGNVAHSLCQGGSQLEGFEAYTNGTTNPTTSTVQYSTCQATVCAATPVIGNSINPETSQALAPTLTGNVFGSTVSAVTSTLPTISVSGNNVTMADTGITGNTPLPTGNTSVWYTTNGTTPAPGTSTFCGYSCTITVANGTVVSAIGMWGAQNQPANYASGWGFVPSSVVTVRVNGGTTPTLTGVSISLQDGTSTVAVGSSKQACANMTYSGVSPTKVCGSGSDAYGTTPSNWTSSNTTAATISSSGNVAGQAAGSSYLTVSAGSFTSGSTAFPVTVTAVSPVLQSIAVNCSDTISVGQAGTCTCLGTYTGPTTGACPSVVWTSGTPSVATVNSSTGALLGIAVGQSIITGTVTGVSPATDTVIVTSNGPPAATVTSTAVSCVPSYVSIGVSLQCQATANYSDGTQTNCTTTDAHGTLCGGWTSSSPSVATVTSSGVVTGESVGTTNISVSTPSVSTTAQSFSVVSPPAGSVLGNTQYNLSGQTYANYINATYAVTPSSGPSTVSSCSFYLPTGYTYPAGSLWDCGIIIAPSGTTQASSWLCHATYMAQGNNADVGWHTLSLSGCGTLSASTGYWIPTNTNESGPIGLGLWDCGSNTGGNTCTGSLPTSGNGTYPRGVVSATYGVYSGMSTTVFAGGGLPQVAAYATLTTPQPTLIGGSITTPGSGTSIQVGRTIQLYAECMYSDGTTYLCSPSPDVYGNTLTSITSSNPSVGSVGAIGSPHPALLSGISPGSTTITGVLTGGVNAQPYSESITLNATPLPPVTPRQLSR